MSNIRDLTGWGEALGARFVRESDIWNGECIRLQQQSIWDVRQGRMGETRSTDKGMRPGHLSLTRPPQKRG